MKLRPIDSDLINPTYVIFCGLHPIAATQKRGRADLVCNRLNRLNACLCKREWETADQDYKEICYGNDYSNFEADNKKYYRVQAVSGLRLDLYDP